MGCSDEESEDEAGVSAIRALGSLFKLTEVFLWDDETEVARRVESSLALDADDANNENFGEKICTTISGISLLPEDIELTEQMNALGLPLSFHTNKEKRIGITMGKRKATVKHSRTQQGFLDKEVEFPNASSREEIVANINFNDDAIGSLCYLSMVNQSEKSDRDVVLDANESHVISGGNISPNLSVLISGAVEEQSCDVMCNFVLNNGGDHELSLGDAVLGDHTEVRSSSIGLVKVHSPRMCMTGLDVDHGKQEEVEPPMELEGSSMTLQDTEVQKSDIDSGIGLPIVPESSLLHTEADYNEDDHVVGCIDESGEWMVYWDSFYKRNYFYNMKTHESTWNPPLGLEHFAFSDANFTENEPSAGVVQMDVLEDIKSEDICVLDDTRSCMNLIGDNVHCQPPDALLEGSSVVAEGSERVASVNTPVNSYKQSDEPQERQMSCKNIGENIGCSCEGHVKQLCHENCSNGFQLIVANVASEQKTFGHCKPSNMNSPEMDCVTIDDDEGAVGLATSSASHMPQQADHMDGDMYFGNGPTICTLGTEQNLSGRNRKKKMKRTRRRGQLSNRNEAFHSLAITEEYPTSITKYWCQRYQLFSRFDDGVKMDKEGWFSVTPEPIARHHASRCGSNTIIDSFTGVGGNAIQFSQRAKHVIAIDIDPIKIRYAQHNAAIYGVGDQIDFIKGDFFCLAPHLKADVIFLSPPWGGPDYARVDIYDLKTMLKPHDGYFLFNIAKKIAPVIVMFLPKNVSLDQLAELSLSSDPPWSLEVEKNFLNGKLKAITAYFSNGSTSEHNVT
ncbi:uncharacterized protein LOC120085727 isoform X2 [Benincasa hispida]|uniref:uncharacterized protein LOC120085727 isoform X2 n=1 Tax=Benincasa hispida TaxID=102211 RepID=UPI0018FFF20B|nr:uncharacterized protein LOC120085727 isoform X2 [Benincasa hispida]